MSAAPDKPKWEVVLTAGGVEYREELPEGWSVGAIRDALFRCDSRGFGRKIACDPWPNEEIEAKVQAIYDKYFESAWRK